MNGERILLDGRLASARVTSALTTTRPERLDGEAIAQLCIDYLLRRRIPDSAGTVVVSADLASLVIPTDLATVVIGFDQLARVHESGRLAAYIRGRTRESTIDISQRWLAELGELVDGSPATHRHRRRLLEKPVGVGGCFDGFHEGHRQLISRASRLASSVVVFLNSDRSVTRLKGEMAPRNNFRDRRANILRECRDVASIQEYDEFNASRVLADSDLSVYVRGWDYFGRDIPETHLDTGDLPVVILESGSAERSSLTTPTFEA